MNTTRSPADHLIVREVGDELLILDKESNHIHQLNRTASIVWRMCQEQHAVPQDIAAVLAQEFAVDEVQALQDVKETMQQLEAVQLISGRG